MTRRIYPYSPSTGCTYVPGLHATYPADLIFISEECYQTVIANPPLGKARRHLDDGTPYLVDPAPVGIDELCNRVDTAAAECARTAIGGDHLKLLEYERAATAARHFQEAGFPSSSVPPAVAAWALNGRTPEQAALEIIDRANELDEKLQGIRAARLATKEHIRELLANGDQAQAERESLDAVEYFGELAGHTA